MSGQKVRVVRWSEQRTPSEEELGQTLRREGLPYYCWSNEPGYIYSAHAHSYNKVIYLVYGSIVFGLPEEGEQINLEPGDRLELLAGTTHNAVVGSQGVVCLEAHL